MAYKTHKQQKEQAKQLRRIAEMSTPAIWLYLIERHKVFLLVLSNFALVTVLIATNI